MKIVVDGILTNYEIIGDKGKTFVILHGWKSSMKEWLSVAKNISTKYRVILLDFPGMGETFPPNIVWGTYDYANFVRSFLNKIEVKEAIILGHSFGGRVGIVLASEGNLVSKLILVSSAGIEKKTLSVKTKIFVYKLFVKPLRNILPQFLIHTLKKFGSKDYRNSGTLQNIFIKVVNEDLTNLLEKIKCATLIIWGEKDRVLSIKQAKIIKSLIKDSILRVVWGADHWPHFSKTQEFLTILNENL